jgi:hypothetical protein
MAYVLAIKSSELLAVGGGPAKRSAAQLAAAVPTERWVGASAGHGAKGRRLYDWTRIQLPPPAASRWQRWLLVRRSRRDGELAFYACFAPVDTSLVGLVRVAGSRWAIEMCQPQCTHIRELAAWSRLPLRAGGSASAQRRRVYQPGGRDRRWRSSASWSGSAWMIHR